MKKVLFVLILIVFPIMYITLVSANPIETDAQSYILIDAKTGLVLCEKNADARLYPASTTKILAAVVAIEEGNLNQTMTASKEAVRDIGPDGMNIFIAPGEELRMEDLLNAMLIQSANETANILAENIAPTRKAFVDMMNIKAKELGATNTHFTNPNGMHNDDHYSTARDLSKIAHYAMMLPKFREIVGKKSYAMMPTNMHEKWDMLYTTNKFLYETSEYFSKVTGIKSGFTSQAGFNLVSSAINDSGMELIAVVLGEKDHPKSRVNSDSKELLEHGFKDFAIQKLSDSGERIKSIPVSDAKDNMNVDLVTDNEFSCVLPVQKDNWEVTSTENINPDIKAPIHKGDVLGYIEYEKDGIKLGKVDLVAANDIEKDNIEKLKDMKKNSVFISIAKIVLIVFICLSLLLFILYFVNKNRRAQRRRNAYKINKRHTK